nr:MAG TPA: Surfeit locus protein 5 subunit 22 of Mediator complex [Bacteriophage sp.]
MNFLSYHRIHTLLELIDAITNGTIVFSRITKLCKLSDTSISRLVHKITSLNKNIIIKSCYLLTKLTDELRNTWLLGDLYHVAVVIKIILNNTITTSKLPLWVLLRCTKQLTYHILHIVIVYWLHCNHNIKNAKTQIYCVNLG